MTVAGEITEGFKITEIGELPYDWDVATIDSLNKEDKQSINPMQYPSEIFEYYSIPAYQENKTPMLTKGIEILSQKLLIKRGTVLFGKLNPRVEKVWIVKSESSHRKIGSTEWLPILPNKAKADSDFIYYLSWSDYVMPLSKTLVAGSTPSRQRVDPQSFYKIKVPLPPLPEQQKIASVLSTIQEAKEKTENVIKATKELKKSMMKHLFTYGPVSIEDAEKVPLKETEIGMIPEHWGMVRLGEIAEFKNGINFSSNQKGVEGILTLDVLNMYTENIYAKLNNLYRVRIDLKNKSDYLLKDGDVLFVRSSLKREGVGWASLFKSYKEPVTFCGFIIRCRLEDASKIDNRFLISFLRSEAARKELLAGSEQVAITNINQGLLNRLTLPFPPYNEQVQIAETLRAIDEKINAEQTKKNSLDTLFKTLLSLLMTGKLRVKDLEIPV